MSVVALDGVVRRYDWGSPTEIPALLGQPADGRPVAELWFGTHPDAPADVAEQGRTLAQLVDADPLAALGGLVLDRFGPRLPFLVKVLAAEKCLSIQVHPNLDQARAGFAAEDAAGVPRNAATRTYRDANHKPELLCALTPFEALCGFRPVAETLARLDELAVPELAFLSDALRGPDPLRTAFAAVLQHPDPKALVSAVTAAASGWGRHSALKRVVELTAGDFPGDVGVVLALLLNYVRLEPGEAIYLGAGNVHAYLRGTGVEIMATSDNVLRCGLTSKHVDAPELLRVTDFVELTEPRLAPRAGVFDVPVPDFRLLPIVLGGADDMASLGHDEPWLVLCVEGTVGVGGVLLRPGHAAFVPASDDAVPLEGKGRVFAASVGV